MAAHLSTYPTAAPAEAVPPQTRRRVVVVPAAERIVRQIEAIDAWNAARREREVLRDAACVSRLDQESARREADVIGRTQRTITTRTAAELAGQPGPMQLQAPTAVIAHRHAWFAQRVAMLLEAVGVRVLECTDNGADALGVLIAEQPDILLSGDRLAMMTGDVLLAEAHLFAPLTLLAVHAGDPVQAHARRTQVDAVFLRHLPPRDVAEALGELCLASADGARQ